MCLYKIYIDKKKEEKESGKNRNIKEPIVPELISKQAEDYRALYDLTTYELFNRVVEAIETKNKQEDKKNKENNVKDANEEGTDEDSNDKKPRATEKKGKRTEKESSDKKPRPKRRNKKNLHGMNVSVETSKDENISVLSQFQEDLPEGK
jgi:hypothetical protein